MPISVAVHTSAFEYEGLVEMKSRYLDGSNFKYEDAKADLISVQSQVFRLSVISPQCDKYYF